MSDSDPFQAEIVVDARSNAIKGVGEAIARYLEGLLLMRQGSIESPIEAAFWVHWLAIDFYFYAVGRVTESIVLHPQYLIKVWGSVYRPDFAVPNLRVAIELDGHDFHERTKQQVAYRNERDRKLQMGGWCVFHISGSEVFQDGFAKALSIYECCADRLRDGESVAVAER